MAIQLSPGVLTTELDLTTTAPAVSMSVGAFAGEFIWGPANIVTTVTSEKDLVSGFGKPTSDNYVSFFSASNFLAYSNNLKLVRVIGEDSLNAVSANGNSVPTESDWIIIPNEKIYQEDENVSNGILNYDSSGVGHFVARYPGALGNSLGVSICADSSKFQTWGYKNYFTSAPGTSLFAKTNGKPNAKDELHIIVYDKLGKITGKIGEVLEKYSHVSKARSAKLDDGTDNYYVSKLYNESLYVYAYKHLGNNWGSLLQEVSSFDINPGEYNASFGQGADTFEPDYISAYDLFSNKEEIDISLIITGEADVTIATKALNIASERKDCIAFISPPLSTVIGPSSSKENEIITWVNELSSTDSFGFMGSNWKYQFDKYNNVYRYVPDNADLAGLCARTDNVRDPWWSPAGFNRGKLLNCLKLAWNPSLAQRDALYNNNINPVVSFPGEGALLYGDKTLQRKPSAFDRINVRRLFITLEKSISNAAKYSLFEFNDEFTRAQFVNMVEPYLRDVKGRRGIYDYRVVCDTTNNTPQVIDSNRFVGDIYIKPSRSINFIQLNFVAVGTGVQFDEIAG